MKHQGRPILEVQKLHKKINGQVILDDVSFGLHKGTCLGIIGENGSGKTTLINVLSRLVNYDSGDILMNGVSYTAKKPHELAALGIGRSFQYSRNFGTSNIEENLFFAGGDKWTNNLISGVLFRKNIRQTERKINESARKIFDSFGIDSENLLQNKNTNLSVLSLGQQRVIELVRLFLLDSCIFLLDEPTVHLNKDLTARLGAFIKSETLKGKSFIIISHDYGFLKEYSDNLLIIEQGIAKHYTDTSGIDSELKRISTKEECVPEIEKILDSEPVLELSNICAGYSNIPIFQGIDLKISAGEIITVTGDNGSGKSTLLKAIFGTVQLQDGVIKLNGVTINSLLPEERVKRGISYIFQEKKIFSRMTVEENLRVAFKGEKRALLTRLSSVYLKFPKLKVKKDLSAGILSGGEQQLLAIGRVLMNAPKIILFDEPFSGLSNTIIDSIIGEIKSLANTGVACLIVEHRVDVIKNISSKIIDLNSYKTN